MMIMMMHTLSFIHWQQTATSEAAGRGTASCPPRANNKKQWETKDWPELLYERPFALFFCLFVCLLRGMRKTSSPLLLQLQCHFSPVYCQFLSERKNSPGFRRPGDTFSMYSSPVTVAGGGASFSCCRCRHMQVVPPTPPGSCRSAVGVVNRNYDVRILLPVWQEVTKH